MFSKRSLVFGLVALATCAGCARGTRTVVIEPGDGGMASPPTIGDQLVKCDEGRFNAAAGLCVSEGDGSGSE